MFTASSSGKAFPVPAIRKLSALCVMASINPEGLFRKLRNALALRRLPRPLQFFFPVSNRSSFSTHFHSSSSKIPQSILSQYTYIYVSDLIQADNMALRW